MMSRSASVARSLSRYLCASRLGPGSWCFFCSAVVLLVAVRAAGGLGWGGGGVSGGHVVVLGVGVAEDRSAGRRPGWVEALAPLRRQPCTQRVTVASAGDRHGVVTMLDGEFAGVDDVEMGEPFTGERLVLHDTLAQLRRRFGAVVVPVGWRHRAPHHAPSR